MGAPKYRPRMKKRGRVRVRGKLELSEVGPGAESPGNSSNITRTYNVRYRYEDGSKEDFGLKAPITVHTQSFKELDEIARSGTMDEHRNALQSYSPEEGHMVAAIEDFFGYLQPLPERFRGLGIGAGSMDLLLKELHSKGVDFVTIMPTRASRELIKKRGFKKIGPHNIYVLTKQGLFKHIEGMEKEEGKA